MTYGWTAQSRAMPLGRLFFFGAVGGLVVGAVLGTVSFLNYSSATVQQHGYVPDEFMVGISTMLGGFVGVVVGVLVAGATCASFLVARRRASRRLTYAIATVAAALVGGLCAAFLVRSQVPSVATVMLVAAIVIAAGGVMLVSLWALGGAASRAASSSGRGATEREWPWIFGRWATPASLKQTFWNASRARHNPGDEAAKDWDASEPDPNAP